VPLVEVVRALAGQADMAGEESLQTKLQTNHAAQHGTGHNNLRSLEQKCRTRAHAWLLRGTHQHENLRTRKRLYG